MYRMKLTALLLAALVAAVVFARPAAAEEGEKSWGASLDLTLNSKYVWRGIDLVDDPVFQPSLSARYRWITFCLWGSMETTDANYYPDHGSGKNKLTEIDYIIDLSQDFGKLGFSTGAFFYRFPNTGLEATSEIYASLRLNLPVRPALTVYYDVDQVHGVYFNFTASHKMDELWKPTDWLAVSLELLVGVGFGTKRHNEYYYYFDENAATDALAKAALPVAFGNHITLTPAIYYTTLIGDNIRHNMRNIDNIWYGASLNLSL